MEEGKKKIIMVVIIVACIVAAAVITLMTHSSGEEGGVDTIKRGELIWLKCRSPKCENAWQMDKRDYYEYINKNRVGLIMPGIPCPKCGEKDGYKAAKCPKCGFVFEKVFSNNDVSDRCPKCSYSAWEEQKKQAKEGTGNTAATPAAAPAAEEKK